MRPIYLTAILVLASGGGGVVYSAAPAKTDAPSTAQQTQHAKPDRRAVRTTKQKPYIGSTYVGTRSAAQGAGKPLAPGGAAFDEAQQARPARGGSQASAGDGAGERISPARGTLASERPQQPSEQQSGQAPSQQPEQQSNAQPAQQSGAQQSGSQEAPQGAADPAATQRADTSGFDVKSTFRNICGFCHEDYGRHAGKGPQLMNSERSDEFMVNRIKHGMPGRMPGFGSTFNDAQIHQIVEFIRALKPGEDPKNPA